MNDIHDHQRSYNDIAPERMKALFEQLEQLSLEHKAHFQFHPDASLQPYCGMMTAAKKIFFKTMSAKIECGYDAENERLTLTVHEKPDLVEISVIWRAIDKMVRASS